MRKFSRILEMLAQAEDPSKIDLLLSDEFINSLLAEKGTVVTIVNGKIKISSSEIAITIEPIKCICTIDNTIGYRNFRITEIHDRLGTYYTAPNNAEDALLV